MSNPFKVGDKVVYLHSSSSYNYKPGSLHEIVGIDMGNVYLRDSYATGVKPLSGLPAGLFRAAIPGIDYPATKRDDNLPLNYAANSGHLSDGSSIQKHSAGGLYPVVIWHRDKKLPGVGKYDVGLTWPDQADTVWFRDYDSAINVAEAIKESLK